MPGADLPRLAWPTLGGKQLWGDEFLYAGYRIQQNVLTGHHRLLDPSDIRLATGSWAHCHETFGRLRDQRGLRPESDHLVLLLHGYFRSKDSFSPMARALRRAGYEASGVNYPSTRQTLQDHADQVERLLNRAEDVSTVSFVTHSMGGIVARVVLGRKSAWRRRLEVNRLVMIATPNRGAEMAVRMGRVPGFSAVSGPCLDEIHPGDPAQAIPVPDVPFGIIAGGRGDGRGYNPLLEGDDDFTVTVASTELEGAEDFLVVNALHTFIMQKPEVIEATQRYLETGRFG